jgi:hypothetical protein
MNPSWLLTAACFLIITNFYAQQNVEMDLKRVNCLSENLKHAETTIVGSYGVSDFDFPNPEISVYPSALLLHFDSTNLFQLIDGNSASSYYSISDSNTIEFYCGYSTLLYSEMQTKSGYVYSTSLFGDSLLKCNSFKRVGEEIKFYRDSECKISFKPFVSLMGFPERKSVKSEYIFPIEVGCSKRLRKPLVINSKAEALSAQVDLSVLDVDFEKSSLIVIENKSIQKLKQRKLRRVLRYHKKKDAEKTYPTTCAKLSLSNDSIYHLDLINACFSFTDKWKLKGRFMAFVVDKLSEDDLETTTKYIY